VADDNLNRGRHNVLECGRFEEVGGGSGFLGEDGSLDVPFDARNARRMVTTEAVDDKKRTNGLFAIRSEITGESD
jgi:hypothetical protein